MITAPARSQGSRFMAWHHGHHQLCSDTITNFFSEAARSKVASDHSLQKPSLLSIGAACAAARPSSSAPSKARNRIMKISTGRNAPKAFAGPAIRWSNHAQTQDREEPQEEPVTVTVQPITPDFAAEVGDVVLGKPLAARDLAAIRAAFTKYAVLVFPDQNFDDESHLDFARNFGPLETTVFKARKDHKLRLHEMADVGNLDADNRILQRRRPPAALPSRQPAVAHRLLVQAPAGLLLDSARAARIPPIGGHTEFADMRAAYDALREATKRRIGGLVAEHSMMISRAKLGFTDFDENERKAFEPVPQVLVRRLQDSGRMSLYLASHAGAIRGMADGEAEGCWRS